MIVVTSDARNAYIDALEAAIGGRLTPLVELVADRLLRAAPTTGRPISGLTPSCLESPPESRQNVTDHLHHWPHLRVFGINRTRRTAARTSKQDGI